MLEIIKQQLNSKMDRETKINKVREFLQILILKIIYDRGYFARIAFEGGTALRIIFDTRRFSEDLDFSLIEMKNWNFSKLTSNLKHEIDLRDLNCEMKLNKSRPVQSIFIKFPGLLHSLNLSNFPEQKISIKLEIDTSPPAGAKVTTSYVSKIYILNLTHLDLSSMFAKKLHACFFRDYIKGRDFYDLVWYLGKSIKPNFTLLNNAIKQTETNIVMLNESNFKKFLLNKLKQIDFTKVKDDVKNFLQDQEELKLLDLDLIKQSIEKIEFKGDS